MSGRSARTIRNFSVEVSPDLVLLDMGKVDFHDFGKYWKLTSSPNTSKLVLGPPDGSSFFFESQGTISGAMKPIVFSKNDPRKTYCPGTWEISKKCHLLIKWLPFLCLCFGPHAFFWAPWGPGPHSVSHHDLR